MEAVKTNHKSNFKTILLRDVLKIEPGSVGKVFLISLIEVLTGLFVSILIKVNLGTDAATFMDVHIANVIGMSFGMWQMLYYLILLVFVMAFSKFRYVGFGTIANTVFIGYSADFFRWLWSRILPESLFTEGPSRIILFIVGIAGFAVTVAIYINFDMGMAPYDAVPNVICDLQKKVPFTLVRILWDYASIGIGCLFGGVPAIGNYILAIVLGPTVTFVSRLMKKKEKKHSEQPKTGLQASPLQRSLQD